MTEQAQPQFRVRINDGITASGKRAYDYTVELIEGFGSGGTRSKEFMDAAREACLRQRDLLQAEMEARGAFKVEASDGN